MERGAVIAYELSDLIPQARFGAGSGGELKREEQRGIFDER